MALGPLLDGFFTEEWVRFTRGVAKLDPEQQRLAMVTLGQKGLLPGETASVNIPGWDQVIKLGPRYQPTPAERGEWYAARREHRAPNLSDAARSSMEYSVAMREAIRTSAQPGYAQAWGEILTAVDNVQDFTSTLSTFGRVGLWGIERGLNAFAPGATTEAAAALAARAAAQAEMSAVATFERALLDAVARGEPVAAYLLGDEVALASARRAAAQAASKAAYTAAFRSAILGLGSRAALRILPVVGWVLLASDLLNWLSLLGMLAMPAYAALCKGPSDAMLAGVPAAVFKGILKKEVWSMHANNPFSRKARAARATRAMGRLPTIGALMEVAQTTENLFGVGITLGGLVGMMMESAYAFERAARGETTRINTDQFSRSFTDPQRAIATPAGRGLADLGAWAHQRFAESMATMSQADLAKNQEAARVLGLAPAVIGTQETFDDETHLKAMLAYAGALSTLAPQLRGRGWQARAAELADVEITAPWPPSPEAVEWARESGYDIEASRGWWFAGNRRTITGREYAEHHAAAVPQAVRDWFIPHRNTVEGALYGALVNAITEAVWLMLEEDDQFLKWELTTDARLMASLAEAGRLVNYGDGETRIWRFWQNARLVLERSGDTSLQAFQWDDIAARFDMTLIKLLPPGSPWPQEWYDWLDAGAPES